MSADSPNDSKEQEERVVAYFMLRVRQHRDDPTSLSGIIERLGTGTKQSFENGDELIRLLNQG
ncbi:MAG TPA: hypothetical protein VFW98_05240 [Gemmatimonadaceae bacterium]|nr:hypothetical protein [Gemmatimonadaceae bacterium]